MKLALIGAAIVLAGGLAATPAFAAMGACRGAQPKNDLDDQIRLYTICLDDLWEEARAGAHHNRGVAYLLKGENAQALADFDASLDYDNAYGLAYFNRSVVFARRGQRILAIEDLTRTLDRYPSRVHTSAHFQRGLMHEAGGDYAAALRDYDEVIDRPVTNGLLAFLDTERDMKKDQITSGMLAKSLLLSTAQDPQIRNGAEALDLAQEALSRREDAAAHAALAAAYAETGRFDMAADYQNRAIQMASMDESLPADALTAGLTAYQAGEAYRADAANCDLALSGVDCSGGGWATERMALRMNRVSVNGFGTTGTNEPAR